MALALPNHWVWDFWTARDGDDFHLFFLQAPKSIGDPDARHWNASIGHAVSRDLKEWTALGECFRPSPRPAWDDGTTWTGSVIRHAGRWWMFYTGTCRAEGFKRQRIGVATSNDLHSWERHATNPVVDLDPQLYEEYDPALWHDRSLRDPWVAPDPNGRGFRMWFTARVPYGPSDGRGVIGTARSDDLVSWKLEAAVTPPGNFGECEVPQYFALEGRHYLLFSTSVGRTSIARLAQLAGQGEVAETGTHYFLAGNAEGPWRLAATPFLTRSTDRPLYAGRVVLGVDGRPNLLGFEGPPAGPGFGGAICDPIPIAAAGDGRLQLVPRPA